MDVLCCEHAMAGMQRYIHAPCILDVMLIYPFNTQNHIIELIEFPLSAIFWVIR